MGRHVVRNRRCAICAHEGHGRLLGAITGESTFGDRDAGVLDARLTGGRVRTNGDHLHRVDVKGLEPLASRV